MKKSVTITWVDAEKRKPDSMTEVLVVTRRNRVCLGHYNAHLDCWYEHEDWGDIPVSYWAEKPLPPSYL